MSCAASQICPWAPISASQVSYEVLINCKILSNGGSRRPFPPVNGGLVSWPGDLLMIGLRSRERRIHLQVEGQAMQVLNDDLLSLVQGPEHLSLHVWRCRSGWKRRLWSLGGRLRSRGCLRCGCWCSGASPVGPWKCNGRIDGVPAVLLHVCKVDHRDE